MATPFTLGEPFKSAEQASKAKRTALLGLCAIAAFQAAVGLFFWWMSIFDNSTSGIVPWPNYDGILLFIFAVIIYFSNSRVVAVIILALAALELLGTWIPNVVSTGNFAPPGIGLLLALAAGSVAMAVFKTHAWQQTNNTKLPRSKWVMWALIATFILVLAGFFIPPTHFWHHATYEVALTEKGNVVEYYEPLDRYSLEFPQTWKFDQPPLQYGDVTLSRADGQGVTVQIERWQPWSIAPVALFNRDAFLKMAQDEATTYSTENNLTVETVEMTGPTSINEARVVYAGLDGSKRYVYYIYDRAWRRQTSDAAYFFWRLTADVPKDSLTDDADIQSVLNSFKINQAN